MFSCLVSSARKSSGKTSFSVGLAASLTAHGDRVQTFKKGPDYIDPMWLSRASEGPCWNLDFHTMTPTLIAELYSEKCAGSDSVIVEGNKGLYDGVDPRGTDCNAALAKLLGLPVILLLDASGITRGIAPLVQGYCAFDADIEFAGVILNKVAGTRHEQKLRHALELYTDLPVLGAIHRSAEMEIEERHIGLVPSSEYDCAQSRVRKIAGVVSNSVDLDRLKAVGQCRNVNKGSARKIIAHQTDVVIAVARDEAFGFYYPDDFQALEQAGAELKFFNTMKDNALPEADGLFIGGGFPEFYLDELESNFSLRAELKQYVDSGRPVYAECGGLMYLSRGIEFNGMRRSMVGALDARATMEARPVGRGYVRLQELGDHPWPSLGQQPVIDLPAHEFHYSRLVDLGENLRFAYAVKRGVGIKERFDGLVYKNLLATYSHHRSVGCNRWAERFVSHIREQRTRSDVPHNVAL